MTTPPDIDRYYAPNRDDWRTWLEANHYRQ
jgi:hypothetical protein